MLGQVIGRKRERTLNARALKYVDCCNGVAVLIVGKRGLNCLSVRLTIQMLNIVFLALGCRVFPRLVVFPDAFPIESARQAVNLGTAWILKLRDFET